MPGTDRGLAAVTCSVPETCYCELAERIDALEAGFQHLARLVKATYEAVQRIEATLVPRTDP